MAKQTGNQRLHERVIALDSEILLLQIRHTYAPRDNAYGNSILDSYPQNIAEIDQVGCIFRQVKAIAIQDGSRFILILAFMNNFEVCVLAGSDNANE